MRYQQRRRRPLFFGSHQALRRKRWGVPPGDTLSFSTILQAPLISHSIALAAGRLMFVHSPVT
jgi:hypothetical protein